MLCTKKKRCLYGVLTLIISVLGGVLAGYMHLEHFAFSRLLFWIALATAGAMWLLMMYSFMRGRSPRVKRGAVHLYFISFALLAASALGVVIADSHTVAHCVLFGINVGLLSELLFSAVGCILGDERHDSE